MQQAHGPFPHHREQRRVSLLRLYIYYHVIVGSSHPTQSSSPPQHWLHHEQQPHAHRRDYFYFYLKEQNLTLLDDHLRRASDPTYALYHQTSWLTFDQMVQLARPDPVSTQRLYHFLWSHQVDVHTCRRTRDGSILACSLLLSVANKMFLANYTDFRHRFRSINVTRTLSFTLPHFLSDHIVTVTPTNIFPHSSLFVNRRTPHGPEFEQRKPRKKRQDSPCDCQYYTQPCFLRHRYDIDQYSALPSTNTTLSIIGLLDQYINDDDTRSFLDSVDRSPDLSKARVNILGYDNQSMPGREASLDVQYALAIARGVETSFWSIANSNDPFSDFLFQLADMEQPPHVISLSYGFTETASTFAAFQTAINQQLRKATARGITVIAATGDGGVGGGDAVGPCHSYRVNFPASSPWVTAVGATTKCFETGAQFSGGGFSTYESRPTYQQQAVARYLEENQSTLPPTALFNAGGRAIPDVALRATRYLNIVNGVKISTSGTSASAPVFAALISLLNDHQVRHGRKRLGFLNPLLYQHASEIFYDITTGHNTGCNSTGFSAAIGWDPVTGLGTPSFVRFQRVLDSVSE